MIEFIVASWLWLATWPILIGLLVFGVIMEYNDNHKFAAFLTIVSFGIAWTIFDEQRTLLTYLAFGYIPIGLVWSIWRWNIYCKKKVRENVELAADYYSTTEYSSWRASALMSSEDLQRSLQIRRPDNIQRVISWILCWPVSVLERLIGDFIEFIRLLAIEWMGGVFNKIASSSIQSYDNELATLRAKHPVTDWKKGD